MKHFKFKILQHHFIFNTNQCEPIVNKECTLLNLPVISDVDIEGFADKIADERNSTES